MRSSQQTSRRLGEGAPPLRDRLSWSLDTEREPQRGGGVAYVRCTIGRWNIDLDSEEGREAFRQIDTEGVRVFRSQPGFIRYRLMVADPTTTIAVAEWESEELGKPGARRYRE